MEGLINQRGIHASGVIITNNNYTTINACMKAPKGQLTTQWDLHDTEAMGGLKYDFLTVKTLDKIRKTMFMLIQKKYIEWQGSLKKTYDKYLSPRVLDYNDPAMWDKITEIPSLFQFDTVTGGQTVKIIKPRSIEELSTANALTRLMGDGGEVPSHQYARYKSDENEWLKDTEKWGLNDEERAVIKKYLNTSYGIAESQEKVMLLSMEPKISGFTLKEANKVRKAIAKKKPKLLAEMEQLFYQKGEELGTRKEFLKYVWDEVFAKSRGYSFSSLHGIGYSLIALQQMNLYCKYPAILWNTACLIVDSCGNEDNEENKSQDYGKTAIAIDNLTKNGVKVLPPDINKSGFEFTPDLETNSVFYGLKGVTGLNDEYTALLLKTRADQPFTSLQDFLERIPSVKKQVINIIKSGMFDNLYPEKTREDIMKLYFEWEINKEGYGRKSLNAGDIEKAIELGVFADKYAHYVYHYNFYKEVSNKKYFFNKVGNKVFHLIKTSDYAFQFFDNNYKSILKEGEDYSDVDEGICFRKASLDKAYKKIMDGVIQELSKPETLTVFNQKCYDVKLQELWDKYCKGSISSWEMDSLCYYSHPHELENVDREKYGIQNFFELPEEAEVLGCFDNGAPRHKLTRIMGTVIC